jgi:hypothetical protein
MNIKKILAIGLFFASSTVTFANNESPPNPPMLSDLSSFQSCVTYASQMQNYLDSFSSQNDMYNSVWFEGFSIKRQINNFQKKCDNNGCTSFFGVNAKGFGNVSGCTIAMTNATNAKNTLFDFLTQAYQLAIQHQTIMSTIDYASFGLYGNADICDNKNNYLGCELYLKRK